MNFPRQGTPKLATILLAHGAGSPMDSPFMTDMADLLIGAGFEVVRFEFPYMQQRREKGLKRPPDRAPILLTSFKAAITALNTPGKLIIGGKSMGGRIASMLAADNNTDKTAINIHGVLCLGYPFHAPGKPEKLRIDHLPKVSVPTLIIQGEHDPFGGRTLLETLNLPACVHTTIIPDGNHDLAPRKRSSYTHAQNLETAAQTTRAFFGKHFS